MPFVTLSDAVEIQYVVIGDDGPWVVALPSGRFSHEDLLPFAHQLAAHGCRVLLHDRRNCGQSSLSFDFEESEDRVWADDLHALLGLLGIDDVALVGRSRGARVAVLFAGRHPELVRGVVLWGLSGGRRTAEQLEQYYYGKYERACRDGGMAAVVELDHFCGVAGARPENRDLLLSMPPDEFLGVLQRWRRQYHQRSSDELLGLLDEELRRVTAPTLILPWYDLGHPREASLRAQRLLPDATFVDFDPTRPREERSTVDDTAVVVTHTAHFLHHQLRCT